MDNILEQLMNQEVVKQLSEKFSIPEADVISKLQDAGPDFLGIFADGKIEQQELIDAASKLFEGGTEGATGLLDKVKGFFGQ